MIHSSVKNKIRGGTLFLFLLVILSGGLSVYYLAKLRLDSKNVSKANYESLVYAHNLQIVLDSLKDGKSRYIDSFSKVLARQQGNITEPGEYESTNALRQLFPALQKADGRAIAEAHKLLQQIISLNMQAIKIKNERSENAAENALTFLITILSFIFIIGFTFVYNFPSVISTPIQKLNTAIKEIAQKNYKHRVHLDSKDEFGELAEAFNDMAERLEYFESSNLNRIIFEKTRAEAVINSLKDASIGIDKNDTVLFANGQALLLLGIEAKDIVGFKADEVSRRNDLFRFLLGDEGNVPFKIVVDNRENYFSKELIEIAQDGSNSKVIVVKNITSFKELDAAKTNFIATISHELKTPLASSDISIKLLADERIGKLSSEQKGLMLNLKQDNQRMLRILSELLNMAQVEAGKIQMDITPVSAYHIADKAIMAIINTARENRLSITKSYQEHLPEIMADAEKTSWVLNNFLTNAIKYSPEGAAITMRLSMLNNTVEFCVADQGPGIPSEYLPRVFERFFKVPGSKERGTGLGLAISKEFIEAESGRIWVRSEIGVGSQFGFNLPLAPA